MKATFVLIALLLSTPAFARIGETTEELRKRYGRPSPTIRNEEEIRRYSFRGFHILVGLVQGRSQCEVYQKADRSRMTEAEIHALLEANTGASPWRDDPDENLATYTYWSADKKTRVAIYNLAEHSLVVTSKPFLAQFSPLFHSNEKKNQIDGF